MRCILAAAPERHHPAMRAVWFLLAACLVFGISAATASAADHGGGGRYRGNYHRQYGNRGRRRGYYPQPPVVYGSPYYGSPYSYPPPVVYGPGIGISLPGIGIIIH